jgi:hypothetical protein
MDKLLRIFIGNIGECFLSIFVGGLYAVAIKYFIYPSQVIMTGTRGYFNRYFLLF